MKRGFGCLVAGCWLAFAAEARADEPVITYVPAEERIARALWTEHREGPHMFFELGFGALYAPGVVFTSERTSELEETILFVSQEGLIGPTGSFRWGVNFGVSQAVDVRVGAGSFLGGAILDSGDQFFAYPHALAQVSFGPGDIYRPRVGIMTGALIFGADDTRVSPTTVQFGLHGEVSPLAFQLGETRNFELSVTQGLGLFIGETTPVVPCDPALGGCRAVGGLPDREPSGVQFAGHTMAAFGAILN